MGVIMIFFTDVLRFFSERLRQFWRLKIDFENTFFDGSCESPLPDTGKSLSEVLIFASTNPQYDNRLFIELQVQYNTSNLGRACCVQKLFPTFGTIFVHNMFSP